MQLFVKIYTLVNFNPEKILYYFKILPYNIFINIEECVNAMNLIIMKDIYSKEFLFIHMNNEASNAFV